MFFMLFIIVLPYAVLVLSMKATSQQIWQLRMVATNGATKVIAYISQQSNICNQNLGKINYM